MSKKELVKRYIYFISGLFVNALGVSLITKANLGTSPISSVPYVLSMGFPLTMGQFTFLLNMVLILGQIMLLRKGFKKIQFLQIPVSFLFGVFIDFTMSLLSFVNPAFYGWKIASLVLGCLTLGFGVSMEVTANVVMLSGEAFVKVVATALKKEFGIMKVCFDASMGISACLISAFLFHSIVGIREGTVIAAVLVGLAARFFNKRFAFMQTILSDKMPISDDMEFELDDNQKIVITIGREFGSGGHEIGKKLALQLGISFYDKDLIDMVARESGYSRDYIKNHEQKIKNPLLYDLIDQEYAYTNEDQPPLDVIYAAESKVMREIARKESCVIVGRCADHILQENPHSLHIFVHADMDFKVKRIQEQFHYSEEKARTEIIKTDKERANHYKRYTNKVWGAADHYHLTVNSGIFGIEGAVELIIGAAECLLEGQDEVKAS